MSFILWLVYSGGLVYRGFCINRMIKYTDADRAHFLVSDRVKLVVILAKQGRSTVGVNLLQVALASSEIDFLVIFGGFPAR